MAAIQPSTASETSPLLQFPVRETRSHDDSSATSKSNGTFEQSREVVNVDGDPLERQDSIVLRDEGLPEVKKKMVYIMPALAIGIFLSAADSTIIVSSYGKIGTDLKALNLTSWIATAYFLTLTAFQPLYGKLSDIFGRKTCLLFAYAVFGLGCLFCGLAQDMPQLIGARAFCGIGGGMSAVVSILMSDIVPLRERGKWQGYINIVWSTGASAGAPLGGFLADFVGWRWAFLLQVPLCLAAFIAVSLVLHLPQTDEVHWREKLKRIDFLGAALLFFAVFTLLLGLDRGSNESWSSTITIVAIAISVPLFLAFNLVEIKVAKEPFAPGHIIFNHTLIACYLCNFFALGGWISATFYLPLYFQVIDGVTATGAGLRLIPSILFSVCGSLSAGFYMQKTGHYYWLTIVAYSFLTLGMTVIFLCSNVVINSTAAIIVGMCACGFGSGIGVTSTLIGLIANASKEDQAVATACSYLFRSLGSVFGVALSATIANQALRSSLSSELPALGLPEEEALEIAERVRQSLAYLRQLEPDVKAIVADCYARSTSSAFGVEIGLVAGAAVSAWFIHEKLLSR